ncbi:hypothetical protein GCM10009735_17820 [Actinomadura chokoriensis]
MLGSFRPVVDPDVPEKDREILASSPDALTAAFKPAPAKPSLEDGAVGDAAVAILTGAGCAIAPVIVMPTAARRAGLAVGAVLQAGLVAAAWFGGLWVFLTVAAVIGVAVAMGAYVRFRAKNAHRLACKHHGRYYTADDFDERTLQYVSRARRATRTVMNSRISKAGLLDDVANAVTLPRQEWEVARTCAELTRIELEISEVASKNAGLTALLEKQRRALALSAEAVERRVAALEQYADRTKAASAAYREYKAIKQIEEIQADVQELLAQTVQDELAVAEIDRLSADTPLAELQRAVDAAKEAGLALTAEVHRVR